MLIGLQCQVASTAADRQREKKDILALRTCLTTILEGYDREHDMHVSKDDFQLLVSDPELADFLDEFGTDIGDLTTMSLQLYTDEEEKAQEGRRTATSRNSACDGKLSFAELLQLVLQLRSSNSATVTDVATLKDYLRIRFDRMEVDLKSRHCMAQFRSATMPEEQSATSHHKATRSIGMSTSEDWTAPGNVAGLAESPQCAKQARLLSLHQSLLESLRESLHEFQSIIQQQLLDLSESIAERHAKDVQASERCTSRMYKEGHSKSI